MSIDISGLNAPELRELAAKIDKRVVEVEKETLQKARNEMRAIATKLGVDFEDVIRLHSRTGKKSAAKYANPDNPAQTWTGRGRKPAWVIAALEAGKSIDDLTI
ncbi:H-NS histone family protein [Ruegeria sp. SCPT10]|uniref:H-NS histone family protein n=1 Tax=Ruegeria sp. SCP10 TaxID=3141377 RepID=UPI003337B276